MGKAKPFNISKRVVFEAYIRVKANKGAAGVDGESIADFEKNLKNNLYKIWNRMSSGSYFPPAVLLVEIAKKGGGLRELGVTTVSDRIAQMVAKMYFEQNVDPMFPPDSYGYRPGKSAIEAIGVARKRCWRHNWVLDLDIKGFFDNNDHEVPVDGIPFLGILPTPVEKTAHRTAAFVLNRNGISVSLPRPIYLWPAWF